MIMNWMLVEWISVVRRWLRHTKEFSGETEGRNDSGIRFNLVKKSLNKGELSSICFARFTLFVEIIHRLVTYVVLPIQSPNFARESFFPNCNLSNELSTGRLFLLRYLPCFFRSIQSIVSQVRSF